MAEEHYERVRGGRPGTLGVSALSRLEPSLCRALLRRWIREEGFRVPNSRRLDRIVEEMLPAAADCSPLVEWPEAQVRRYRDELFVISPLPEPPADTPIDWNGGAPLVLPGGLGQLSLNAPAPTDRLQVRFGVAGARCPMAGGGRKRLKKLFQESGVPDWVRPYVPLIYLNGVLSAVGGLRTCAGGVVVAWEAHPFRQVMP